MSEATYDNRREELKVYFDRTARDNWVALTSNTPVSRIRETVRKGRSDMRETLLQWLPADLNGARVLDAGCGTGMLAIEAARRGADVIAVDISPSLIAEAAARLPEDVDPARLKFLAGDMHDAALGCFDFVVAMDSLIHYPLPETIRVLEGFASRTRSGIFFTFAPKTTALSAMKAMGKLFPRNDRSPSIEPVRQTDLFDAIDGALVPRFRFHVARTKFVSTGFYKSQAVELTT